MAGHAALDGVSPGKDIRDRLILALYAQLKAERDTREALEYVIRKGAISPEVLEAIAADPIPGAAEADIAAVDDRQGNPQRVLPAGGLNRAYPHGQHQQGQECFAGAHRRLLSGRGTGLQPRFRQMAEEIEPRVPPAVLRKRDLWE